MQEKNKKSGNFRGGGEAREEETCLSLTIEKSPDIKFEVTPTIPHMMQKREMLVTYLQVSYLSNIQKIVNCASKNHYLFKLK